MGNSWLVSPDNRNKTHILLLEIEYLDFFRESEFLKQQRKIKEKEKLDE